MDGSSTPQVGLTGFAVGHCPRSAREATKIASIRSIPRTLCGQAANIVDRQGLVVTPEFLPAEGGAFGGAAYHRVGIGFQEAFSSAAATSLAGPLRKEDPLRSWLRSNVRSSQARGKSVQGIAHQHQHMPWSARPIPYTGPFRQTWQRFALQSS